MPIASTFQTHKSGKPLYILSCGTERFRLIFGLRVYFLQKSQIKCNNPIAFLVKGPSGTLTSGKGVAQST